MIRIDATGIAPWGALAVTGRDLANDRSVMGRRPGAVNSAAALRRADEKYRRRLGV